MLQTRNSACSIFSLRLTAVTDLSGRLVFEILRSNRIGLTSLTFQGHVMSSVTWPFDSPYAISYWWSFGTQSLNQAVFDILHSMRIGVTSLTVQGYVTSSVTWPFDSPYAISYWWSFGTKPLSLTVSEIFNDRVPDPNQHKWSIKDMSMYTTKCTRVV